MPLIKGRSKKSFDKNVETEMEAGKPQDQSLAIAYNMKKKNAKKMAFGGMAEDDNAPATPMRKPDDMRLPEDEYMASRFADGGMVEMKADSIADAIMRKRKAKKMADGGMVDIQDNGEEEGSTPYDQMNEEAAMKELYDDSQLEPQPMDSNEHSDDIDTDEHDMVSMIQKKIRSKRGMMG